MLYTKKSFTVETDVPFLSWKINLMTLHLKSMSHTHNIIFFDSVIKTFI